MGEIKFHYEGKTQKLQKEFLQKLIFTLNWTLSLQRLTNFTSVILNWIFKQNKKNTFKVDYLMATIRCSLSFIIKVIVLWKVVYFVRPNFVAFNQI